MRGERGIGAGAWLGFGAFALTLGGCATDPTDFERSAEAYIESDAMTTQAGMAFNGAKCDRPTATKPGTAFSCTASTATGGGWTFDVVIVDGSNFEITGRPA